MIEFTDNAYAKLVERLSNETTKAIRFGVTGGGCTGHKYIFDICTSIDKTDYCVDFGKFKVPMTLLWPLDLILQYIIISENKTKYRGWPELPPARGTFIKFPCFKSLRPGAIILGKPPDKLF